jgi:hypothetical protein
MRIVIILGLAAVLLASPACTTTDGSPVSQDELGFRECEKYFDCGPGRYCGQDGFCWSDCRLTADCYLIDKGPLCNLFGECVEAGGTESCSLHEDCGEGHFCNGRCSFSGSSCGSAEECPFFDDGAMCSGTCAPQCASDNDCIGWEESDLTCTPVGQCLLPGWEKWIPAGELPPTGCKRDAQCRGLGWSWFCDCPKSPDSRTGIPTCDGGAESLCNLSDDPLDFGAGPDNSPAHGFTGIWGMRMEIGVVTLGLPLVGKQNTYSSNLLLIKISHHEGNTLVLEEKLCDIQLINFIDSDEPFTDLAWVVIPLSYLKSMPILNQTVELASANPGGPFETSTSTEVRGCVLDDPLNDPLPDRHDFDENPDDPRFIDQDEDGHVALTTLMDGVLRGAIYNVQRWSATYHGRILDTDHIKGLSTINNEQLVISASNPSLIYDTQTEIHAEQDRTYHRLQRLPDDASCKDLIRLGNRDDSWLKHTPHLDDIPDP